MGSAFYREPLYGREPEEVVTFLTFPNDANQDLCVHGPNDECSIGYPHSMTECGMFERLGEVG